MMLASTLPSVDIIDEVNFAISECKMMLASTLPSACNIDKINFAIWNVWIVRKNVVPLRN